MTYTTLNYGITLVHNIALCYHYVTYTTLHYGITLWPAQHSIMVSLCDLQSIALWYHSVTYTTLHYGITM